MPKGVDKHQKYPEMKDFKYFGSSVRQDGGFTSEIKTKIITASSCQDLSVSGKTSPSASL